MIFTTAGVEGDGTKRGRARWRKGEKDEEEQGCNQHEGFRAALTGLRRFVLFFGSPSQFLLQVILKLKELLFHIFISNLVFFIFAR